MSSLRRIDASRPNGSQGHGSAQNARAHALTTSFVLAKEFNTQLEARLDAKWRQRRLWNIETSLLDHAMEKQENSPKNVLHNPSRYEPGHRSARKQGCINEPSPKNEHSE